MVTSRYRALTHLPHPPQAACVWRRRIYGGWWVRVFEHVRHPLGAPGASGVVKGMEAVRK